MYEMQSVQPIVAMGTGTTAATYATPWTATAPTLGTGGVARDVWKALMPMQFRVQGLIVRVTTAIVGPFSQLTVKIRPNADITTGLDTSAITVGTLTLVAANQGDNIKCFNFGAAANTAWGVDGNAGDELVVELGTPGAGTGAGFIFPIFAFANTGTMLTAKSSPKRYGPAPVGNEITVVS